MKLLFFGTCAGTEPIDGIHHAAIALETNGKYYWFDAGENCSRTAHLMGVDLLKVKAVFISHTHLDHVGGLENLLWNIRKLSTLGKGNPPENKVEIFIPNMDTMNGIMTVLKNTEGGFKCNFDIVKHRTIDGLLYKDENVFIYAVANTHLEKNSMGEALSYSYIIDCENKRIVYSGDLGTLTDLDSVLENGCDILICETGHHKVENVCSYAKNKGVKKLLFSHNGREIINDIESAKKAILRNNIYAVICKDKDIFEI